MALDFGYWSALTGPMQTAGQRAQNRDAQQLQTMQLMQQMKQIQLKNLENTKGLQEQVNASHTAAMKALYTKDQKFRRQKDVEDFKAILEHTAVNAGEYYKLRCPIAAEAKSGKTWADVH